MRLDARAFGIAAGAIAAVTYVLCGLLVAIAPGATQAAFSYVLHADLTGLARSISVASFTVGLVIFGGFVGLCAYFTATLYNAITGRESVASTQAAPATR